ncbi:hypothetical protein D3C72_521710 [compost metagenome]
MKSKQLVLGGMATLLAVATFGCTSTPSTTTAPQEPLSAIDQAQLGTQSDRTIQSVADLKANLPARISEADAAKMLVQIDPSQVRTNSYSVQQWGFRGGMRGFGGYGGFRGFGRGWYGGFGRGFGAYRYFGYGGRYFPYYNLGSYYYPYTYGSYYPYLYNYSNYYYPYTCW